MTRPYFRFRTITSKYQWISTKLDRYIDIVEIWFGIATWHISSILAELSPRDTIMAGYYLFTFVFSLVIRYYANIHRKYEIDN